LEEPLVGAVALDYLKIVRRVKKNAKIEKIKIKIKRPFFN